jgi:hypothetical protein
VLYATCSVLYAIYSELYTIDYLLPYARYYIIYTGSLLYQTLKYKQQGHCGLVLHLASSLVVGLSLVIRFSLVSDFKCNQQGHWGLVLQSGSSLVVGFSLVVGPSLVHYVLHAICCIL